MKKLFLIGGMGAGKSTARKALTDEGLAWIDLDQVGHEVFMWDTVKDDLRGASAMTSSMRTGKWCAAPWPPRPSRRRPPRAS